jgi:putative aldouronate transport system substrate-binding protein
MSEIAACNNVCAKYENALDCGELDPAVYIPIFMEELKKAGLDTIIAQKQAQLDAWLAAK